ncbi:amidase [Phaeovulum sp. W22_SRMD_FR3]|uniref:amidase n=1 Tax=Phaeovulum sp. W22_SRMD_FR3 TaxID=3240274 RepID=UPI003F9D0012
MWQLDATQLIRAYAQGRLDPVDVFEAHMARIGTLNPVLNAFVAHAPRARATAEAAARRWQAGAPQGPLDGVPVIVKDNLSVAGMPSAWGNAALSQRQRDADELPVAKLRQAGAVILGKGNTPEFAVEGYTDNLTFGPTRNPFDPALTPGGSSGGVVAAVAAGLCSMGVATDGGGSIRRPVGYTGLVGLKPGLGHVARAGGLPQLLLDFEVVGPVARSFGDLRLLDAVLSGSSICRHEPRPALRILAVETLEDAPLDPLIGAAFSRSCGALSAAGHRVQRGALPLCLGPLTEVWGQIAEIGLARYFAADPAVAAAAAPKYREMALRGSQLAATQLYEILSRVFALRDAARGLFGYDAILMPASAANPWPADQTHPAQIDGQPVGPRGHAVYTGWVNACGLPAIGFPASGTKGMPIGMQLIGPMGAEAMLTDLAETVAEPFRWPDLALSSA